MRLLSTVFSLTQLLMHLRFSLFYKRMPVWFHNLKAKTQKSIPCPLSVFLSKKILHIICWGKSFKNNLYKTLVRYWKKMIIIVCLFVWFFHPINNLSVIKGRVFLGWTSTKLGIMFLLKDTTQWRRWGSNSAAPQSRVKHSTTEPLRSKNDNYNLKVCQW